MADLYRGTVTRLDAGGLPFVAIPALNIDELGPLEALAITADGDRVIVGAVAGSGGVRAGYVVLGVVD